MQISVTFKNIDTSDHLKSYIQEKLNRFDKFLDSPVEAAIVLSIEKFRHIAEVNIAGGGLNITGKEETNDMYSAIDLVIDKLDKQIKKNKEKNRQHRANSKSKSKKKASPLEEPKPIEVVPGSGIAIKRIEYKPMDVEEALMQMELTTDNFFVFTNAKTDKVNVLYRRNDGDYGLILPND